ncbi:MAG: hypothetical protein K5867_09875 [Bacteroidales bacterium]|nr:hypothetical protein [Bacteroidales bacterium]
MTNDGNATVTARGVCWSTSHNPTVSNSHTTDGSGTGSFTSSITVLSANTTYYVRAYATNSVGTAYGSEVSFTTSAIVSLPTVTTSSVGSITLSTATCGGNVTNDGNATVTARGVCWSTSHNPTVSYSHTTDGSGTGSFTSSITWLSSNTTYYVRAYATNSAGTAYGEERTFITNTPSVCGFDDNGASNAVFTVASGRTVHFSRGNLQYQASTGTWRFAEHQSDFIGTDNANISLSYTGWIDLFGWGTSGWNSGANAYQPWATSGPSSDYCPGGSYTNSLTGDYANADWGVYNAISNGGNQAGMWRTLTKDEWSYLLFSRSSSTINGVANARHAKAVVNGKKGLVIFPDNFTMPSGMSYPSGINANGTASASYYDYNTYTESEWSQMEGAGCVFLPAAGYRGGTYVDCVGTEGVYWSSSYYNDCLAWGMYSGSGGQAPRNYGRDDGLSVRLVRDSTSNMSLPTVTTSSVSSITSSTATCGGNVTNDGNATVTARGVCWSTSHNPTVSNSHTTDGNGAGSFTSSITGLSQNTTYYVRAYATNSAGTAYGEELTFTTSASVGGFDENGASNAVFTVASGRTVKFSRGNLQYTTTGSHATADGGTAVGTWRFAEHQYDFIGGADNHNISSTYRGWIDLFGWGTSGWSCQPWENENSTTYIYYYWPGGSYTNNLTGSYANADWGVYNAISNGGNQAGMWRTLTKDEWEYLLFSRAASTINGEANARYAKAVVNGTKGLVIFPDNFAMPSGMSNPSGINTSSVPFNNNTYTESEWSQMEGAGCIFLPAAGYRNFRVVSNVGTHAVYWSSSHSDNHDGDYAWGMYFNSGTVGVNDDYRYYGQSVRLVRD